MYRLIKPNLLIEKRGTRSRRQIAEATGNKVSEQAIYTYEKGLSRPSIKSLPHLLAALGVTFEDVSEPVDLGVSQ